MALATVRKLLIPGSAERQFRPFFGAETTLFQQPNY